MEDEALQCAEVRPAELVYYTIHSSYHLPLVWLTCRESKHALLDQVTFHLQKVSLIWKMLYFDTQ